MKAISPKECVEAQKGIVTDWLIKIVNGMITKSWDGTRAYVSKQRIKEICANNKIRIFQRFTK